MTKLNPQDREVLDNFTGMTVGQIFARARGDLGYSLEQIGTHLNIGTAHLQAIEADDAGNLPPKVYAVGFVRAYADVLGLDSEKMAYLFKVQCYGNTVSAQDNAEEINAPQSVLRKHLNELPFHIGSFLFMAISTSIVIAILATMVWLVWPRDNGNADSIMIPPVPAEMTEVITIEPPVIEENIDTIAEEAEAEITPTEPTDLIVKPDEGGVAYGGEAASSALVFKIVDKSWIEIRAVNKGGILLSRTLNKGDVFYTPADTDIMFTTGNAAGVEMYLDGISQGIMGAQGQIIRMRPFSVEALRLQNAPETE